MRKDIGFGPEKIKRWKGMGRAALALIGVGLVAAATLLQMVIDWYQSEAMGVPMPNTLKLLVLGAGALTILALIISIVVRARG